MNHLVPATMTAVGSGLNPRTLDSANTPTGSGHGSTSPTLHRSTLPVRARARVALRQICVHARRGSHASEVDLASWLFVMAFWAVTVFIVIDPTRHRAVCDMSWWMFGQRAPEWYVRGSRVVAPCVMTYLAVAATISWRG